eukprot:TRINITY_DN5150_c0_g1_i1.p1 TRINITY_DN5150_c0_g1~~TRINITY_DN5150_c0_g1_i1.p1  ORF type:complete len:454 (-),score=69.87 TRINITY_DN5150_c0_g1_i1:44-1405(-)
MEKKPLNIIFDTDMGWDDSLSLCYLMQKPETVNILGITVTGLGETHLQANITKKPQTSDQHIGGVAVALALLDLRWPKGDCQGRPGVYVGATFPFQGACDRVSSVGKEYPRESDYDGQRVQTADLNDNPVIHKFPDSFRTDMDDLMGLLGGPYVGDQNDNPDIVYLPFSEFEPEETPAHLYIRDTVLKAEENSITILCLGGFTNIATALFELDDEELELFRRNVKEIYTMAGAFNVPGNIQSLNNAMSEWNQGLLYSSNTSAEWNVFVDPKSVQFVLDCEIPIYFVPLDACNHVILNPSYPATIDPQDEVSKIAKSILILKTGGHAEGNISVPIFDPLATMIMCGDIEVPDTRTGLRMKVDLVDSFTLFRQYVGVAGNMIQFCQNMCGNIEVVNGESVHSYAYNVSDEAFQDQFLHVFDKDLPVPLHINTRAAISGKMHETLPRMYLSVYAKH